MGLSPNHVLHGAAFHQIRERSSELLLRDTRPDDLPLINLCPRGGEQGEVSVRTKIPFTVRGGGRRTGEISVNSDLVLGEGQNVMM